MKKFKGPEQCLEMINNSTGALNRHWVWMDGDIFVRL